MSEAAQQATAPPRTDPRRARATPLAGPPKAGERLEPGGHDREARERDREVWNRLEGHVAARGKLGAMLDGGPRPEQAPKLVAASLQNLEALATLPDYFSDHAGREVLRGALLETELRADLQSLKASVTELRSPHAGREPGLHQVRELYRRHGETLDQVARALQTPGAKAAIERIGVRAKEGGKLTEALNRIRAESNERIDQVGTLAFSGLTGGSQGQKSEWGLMMDLLNDAGALASPFKAVYKVPAHATYRSLVKPTLTQSALRAREVPLWLRHRSTGEGRVHDEEAGLDEEKALRRLAHELRSDGVHGARLPPVAGRRAGHALAPKVYEAYQARAVEICTEGRAADRAAGEGPVAPPDLETMSRAEVLTEAAERTEVRNRLVTAAQALNEAGRMAGLWLREHPDRDGYPGQPGEWDAMEAWAGLSERVPRPMPGKEVDWESLREEVQNAWEGLPERQRRILAEHPDLAHEHPETVSFAPNVSAAGRVDPVPVHGANVAGARWLSHAAESVSALALRIGVSGGVSGQDAEEGIVNRVSRNAHRSSLRERFGGGHQPLTAASRSALREAGVGPRRERALRRDDRVIETLATRMFADEAEAAAGPAGGPGPTGAGSSGPGPRPSGPGPAGADAPGAEEAQDHYGAASDEREETLAQRRAREARERASAAAPGPDPDEPAKSDTRHGAHEAAPPGKQSHGPQPEATARDDAPKPHEPATAPEPAQQGPTYEAAYDDYYDPGRVEDRSEMTVAQRRRAAAAKAEGADGGIGPKRPGPVQAALARHGVATGTGRSKAPLSGGLGRRGRNAPAR